MALSTRAKILANRLLGIFNLRLDSLTTEEIEQSRLKALDRAGHLDRPVFPLPSAVSLAISETVFAGLEKWSQELERLGDPHRNSVGFSPDNGYFGTPDAEVLYTVVRHWKPGRIIEVGCGHSTKVFRQAIMDAGLATELVGIDPCPRTEVEALVDRFLSCPVESLVPKELASLLTENDILSIDSSHHIATGNDVVWLYCTLMPLLQPGVLVHVHDVFLPHDYPRDWVMDQRWGWNEQYLVQCLLMSGAFRVIWPGHYLQRTSARLAELFPGLHEHAAKSLWIEKGEATVSR